jgi:Cys-tRNA(Pro)/Cys-tRNA(Cys) deacylase
MKKQFPTVIDASAGTFDEIYVSGGRIGTTIRLGTKDLAAVTRAVFAEVAVL